MAMRVANIITAAMLTVVALGMPALAADLRIVTSANITSLDPHFADHDPNNAVNRHIFESLVAVDEKQKLQPGLAESWSAIDDLTWSFKLRRANFHDGSPFTAADVIYSLNRAKSIPNSPSSFAGYLSAITSMTAVSEHEIRLTTARPFPALPNYMTTIFVLRAKGDKEVTTDGLNAGKGVIGTGPYKFMSRNDNDGIRLERFNGYWGGKPDWDAVAIKAIPNNAARLAALLSGGADIIESVPPADVPRMRANRDVQVVEGLSGRIIYLTLDVDRETSPLVTTKDGKPIPNPLRDVRVRRALSMSINRESIVGSVMDGLSIPASQLVPPGFFGVNPDLRPLAFDLAKARSLLVEAGYPEGFRLVINGPNDRYVNDRQIAETLAQMFTRLGLKAEVDTVPSSVYFTRATQRDYSVFILGYGSGTTGALSVLRALATTYDAQKGNGSQNRGRYSNPAFDALIDQALVTVDDVQRAALLRQAAVILNEDMGVIPLHFQKNLWGARQGLKVVPRTDGFTLAMSVKP